YNIVYHIKTRETIRIDKSYKHTVLRVYSFFVFIYFCVFLKKVDRIVDKKTWQSMLPSGMKKTVQMSG
ncbi:hypothetical protein MK338_12690, partial [Streptococcus vestibularis]|nr:hypothetical protein [Streptococcus vestibularis]